MSTEVAAHALRVAHRRVVDQFKARVDGDEDVPMLLVLINDGGVEIPFLWELDELPYEVPGVVRQAVERVGAVAGLFVAEVEARDTDQRAIMVYRACPALGLRGTDLFLVDEGRWVRQDASRVQVVDEDNLTWLDDALKA